MKCKHCHKDAPENSVCEDCKNICTCGHNFDAHKYVAIISWKDGWKEDHSCCICPCKKFKSQNQSQEFTANYHKEQLVSPDTLRGIFSTEDLDFHTNEGFIIGKERQRLKLLVEKVIDEMIKESNENKEVRMDALLTWERIQLRELKTRLGIK